MSRLLLLSAAMHRDDASDAAWIAFLAGVPMSWLPLKGTA